MAMRYDTTGCTITATWEWAETGKTPSDIRTVTERHSVQTRQDWIYRAIYGEWMPYGSLVIPPSVVSNGSTLNYDGGFSSSGDPRQPTGGGSEGQIQSTYGTGSADYKGSKEYGKQPIYGWVRVGGVSHSHDPSIYFDDGIVAGYLTFDRCEGSASSPSGSGSYIGQQTGSSDSGTAYYSGDIPPKSGGDPDPTPSIRVQDTTHNYTKAVIEGIAFAVNTYEYFEIEIWNYNLTVYSGQTLRWTETRSDKYAWLDVYGLTPNTGYGFKGFVKQPGGTRNHVGNVSFTTLPSTNVRPQNWEWKTLVSARNTDPSRAYYRNIPLAIVDASEWNNFCKRINDFRLYKLGVGKGYSFTTAISNSDFTSTQFDQAKNAISAMTTVNNPSGFYSKIVELKNALNSVT